MKQILLMIAVMVCGPRAESTATLRSNPCLWHALACGPKNQDLTRAGETSARNRAGRTEGCAVAIGRVVHTHGEAVNQLLKKEAEEYSESSDLTDPKNRILDFMPDDPSLN